MLHKRRAQHRLGSENRFHHQWTQYFRKVHPVHVTLVHRTAYTYHLVAHQLWTGKVTDM